MKFFVFYADFLVDLVLFTAHIPMPVRTTLHAIISLAIRTLEMRIIVWHSEEVELAVSGGTTGDFLVMFADIVIETEFVEFVEIFII